MWGPQDTVSVLRSLGRRRPIRLPVTRLATPLPDGSAGLARRPAPVPPHGPGVQDRQQDEDSRPADLARQRHGKPERRGQDVQQEPFEQQPDGRQAQEQTPDEGPPIEVAAARDEVSQEPDPDALAARPVFPYAYSACPDKGRDPLSRPERGGAGAAVILFFRIGLTPPAESLPALLASPNRRARAVQRPREPEEDQEGEAANRKLAHPHAAEWHPPEALGHSLHLSGPEGEPCHEVIPGDRLIHDDPGQPLSMETRERHDHVRVEGEVLSLGLLGPIELEALGVEREEGDRKSTRLNSNHHYISY